MYFSVLSPVTVASKYFVLTQLVELRPTPGHLPLGGGQQSNVIFDGPT
jgi:hypothetical protein